MSAGEQNPDSPDKFGVLNSGLLLLNLLLILLWLARIVNPTFLAGPLIPCLATALLPGSGAAVFGKRRWSFPLYRIGVAIGLLLYLVFKKTLDPDRLLALTNHWQYLAGGMAMLGAPLLIGAWRWRLLLRGQKIAVKYSAICRVTLVSYFFNTFVPGANGGDFYRLYELAQKKEAPTAVAATTVVLDHFLGLPTLMLCVLAGVICNWQVGDGEDFLKFHYFVKFIGIAAAVIFAGFSALLFGSLYLVSLTARLTQKIPGGPALHKISDALAAYREQPKLLAAAIGISLPIHLATFAAFLLFGIAANVRELHATQYLFLVFAGLSVNYLPLSPGGIGVGEIGFETLFKLAPPFLAANGAAAATMLIAYRIAMLFYGLIGWGIYLAGKQRIADCEITRLDSALATEKLRAESG